MHHLILITLIISGSDSNCFAGDASVSNKKSYAMMKYVWIFTVLKLDLRQSSLKQVCRHFTEIFITGGTGSFPF